MKKYKMNLLFVFLATVFVACSDEDDSLPDSEGMAQVAVKLTDAPGDYEAVYVEVEDVMVKLGAETETDASTEPAEEENWVSLEGVEPQRINLLDLTGGVTELLTETELPAGYLNEMRLVLGDENSIVVDGQELVLETPSAEQSGLKVQVGTELQADRYYTFVLDFDVDKSVVSTGAGSFNLHPILRLSVDENTGSIAGIVSPSADPVLVQAENAEVSVSAYTNAEGEFQLHGLPEGTYLVSVTPEEGQGLEPAVVNNVEVQEGVVTELEPIILEETQTETQTSGTKNQ